VLASQIYCERNLKKLAHFSHKILIICGIFLTLISIFFITSTSKLLRYFIEDEKNISRRSNPNEGGKGIFYRRKIEIKYYLVLILFLFFDSDFYTNNVLVRIVET
jgi:NADH:ubiquinone oxidoreductase subunit 3 (subunit A)